MVKQISRKSIIKKGGVKTRKFKGKTYFLAAGRTHKKAAQDLAKEYRMNLPGARRATYARVVKEEKGYGIWVHYKSKKKRKK
ncbi:MAG: hypothetical protein BV457_07185 [Thermoplasmata archaeon M9B1D]|nr:MAG: hypothetical protein BV457_07185 [Thermoplasmata archaeon M9B1D]